MFDKDSGQSDEARADDIGLGLIICKKIVESSGGQITVSFSDEGKGATFEFFLEMKIPQNSQE